jgi:3-hydroxymyristoyl/3-hydroxydecanoyl-(acyl carrier protein) dehydratase
VPEATRQARVPGDHPCLAGHFPDRPIVPAVLILELAADAARASVGALRVTGVRAAKFVAPLAPEQPMQIHLDWDDRSIRFRCDRDGKPIAHGVLEYAK